MEKETLKDLVHSDILQKLILQGEPTLPENEKQEMWKAIERKTVLQPRRSIRPWRWYAAASVLVLVMGGWFFLQNPFLSNPYARMTGLVDIDTLHNICLYLGEQKVELGTQIEIHCLAASNQIELKSADNMSFKLAAPDQKETYLQVAVPANAKAEVILADQSRITVRELSKFSFPLHLSAQKRNVYLEGEAYMKVARNTSKQFVAETKNMNVAVLGTEFLISAYPQSSEQAVLLISGKVEIEPSEGDKQVLSPNQRYILNTTTHKTSLVSRVDPNPYIYWKENLLEIKDELLCNVLKKIEAVYQTNFTYDWDQLAKIRINGKLDISVPLNELLDRLTKIAPIEIDNTKRKISLSNHP